jgi:DNA gyrase/topoisomerase IV subunit A
METIHEAILNLVLKRITAKGEEAIQEEALDILTEIAKESSDDGAMDIAEIAAEIAVKT